MSEKKQINIPKLVDIVNETIAIPQNELKLILNQQPPAQWIKQNPYANNTNYIPIDKVEYLLSVIYLDWRVEVLDTKLIANAVTCTIRLYVKSPIDGEWSYNDGVGAQEIQTAKGANATDFTQINKGAIQMALPAAKSYAIKDAAECFGNIFGKNLNRKDAADVNLRIFGETELLKEKANIKENSIADIEIQLNNCTSFDDLDMLIDTHKAVISKSVALTKKVAELKQKYQK